MEIKDKNIDNGKPFDFGRVSADYALYRDIYPKEFYKRIADRGLCVKGQRVLDIGTGTGVLPRNMYSFGAEWTGTDISENQIEQAKRLAESAGMHIDFICSPAEKLSFPAQSFDIVTACQCFWYFDCEKLMPVLHSLLKPGGRLVILCMEWLPFEDEIAGKSEEIVLKYSPGWTGAGETRHPVEIPCEVYRCFDLEFHEEYDLDVPFTRESWHGRMRACRGVGASLGGEELAAWEKEHYAMLCENAPESFKVKHFAAMAVLKRKDL